MKILIIADYFQPVIGYAKVKIAQSLIRKGHKVRILTSDRYFPFHHYDQTMKSLLGDRQQIIGISNESGIIVERKKTLLELFSRAFFVGLEKTISQFRPEVVIVFGISSPSAIQAALQKKKYHFRLVFADSHLPSEFELGRLGIKYVFYFLFRVFFAHLINNAGDKFIALQDGTKEIISNVYGILSKIEVIPNGTDLFVFKYSKQKRDEIRKRHKIDNAAFVVIYTGKVIEQKGLDILFRAFSRVITTHSNAYLFVVGSGPELYFTKLRNIVSANTLKNIFIVPSVSHQKLYAYYSAADVAVWPLQESLAMNDAAACSLPFIANNEMGDRVRVSANNAVLYKKGDAIDLGLKLTELLENKKLRREMGKRGRALMKEKFSWDTLAERYIQ